MRAPFIVDEERSLEAFVNDWLPLVRDQRIALDLEEDRMRCYEPQIALLQLTLPDEDATDVIIDPISLSRDELQHIVLEICRTGEVIMHGARNDIVGLKRDFGIAPDKLRDTQVAARFLGMPRFGLAPILEETYGVRLSKAARRSNWLKRPLSDEQIRYARLDTHYLCDLYGRLESELHESGWYDAFEEECLLLSELPPETIEFDPFGWKRIKEVRKLNEEKQRRAAAIWEWRDEYSARFNIHPNRTLPSWAIARLADQGERAMDHPKISGYLSKLRRGAIHELSEALKHNDAHRVRRPRKSPTDERVHAEIPHDQAKIRYESLRNWRKARAKDLSFDLGWLATNDQLDAISRADCTDADDLLNVEGVRQWQVRRFADEWLDILSRH